MEKLGLYIHIPFCKQKCKYCDFKSYSGMEKCENEYVKALCLEIDKRVNKKVSSIFIGGGTPTYLSEEALSILKKSIDKVEKADYIEFTVEANPDSITKEKLEILKSMGVNRISIGVQAFQDDILKVLGRIHTKEQFMKSYKLVRKIGFSNVNLDLMFGLPNQKIEDWRYTLDSVIKLNPEHLSCYSLIIEEGTPFYKMYEIDQLDIPSEDEVMEMYSMTISKLKESGYDQYEISNFSKQNRECKHNLLYWDDNEYIGCGVAAHSYLDGKRKRNEDTINKYIDMIKKDGTAIVETHTNSVKEDMEEFMFLGLRKTKGISIKEFKERFEKDIYEVYKDVIEKYVEQKLLMLSGDRLFLSKRGVEISNSVMSEFML